MMKKKGQMFLITAAIIIVILVLLKTGINLPDILQRERDLKSRFEKEFFSNIADELVKVIDISYHQSSNITNNVFDFGNFSRKKMTGRLQNFNFFYVDAITPASSGSDTMNVTVINLLNKAIDVFLNLNGTIKSPYENPSVTTTTVETEGVVGWTSSIAIDSNDKVHISHSKYYAELRYCNNTLGYWDCTVFESENNASWTSIAIDSNDKVHISHGNMTYYGVQDYNLRYCNNTLGTWTCTNVETGGDVGYYSSIAIDSNDKIHISHYNNTGTDLRYCNNTAGTWTCTNVENGGILTSIAIDSNNKVHISHTNTSNVLKYCNNTAGTWTCINLGGTGTHTHTNSIAIDSNNKVHISYNNESASDLGYCNNTAGTWACTAVETAGDVGEWCSIAIDSNDKVHISHYNTTGEALRHCYTNDFTTWYCNKVNDTGGGTDLWTNDRAIAIKRGRLSTSTSFSSYVHMACYATGDLMYYKLVGILEDSSSWDTDFSITQGDDYTLTAHYDDNQENITIGTKVNKAVYVGFFDITLTGSETTYKDKFQKNYTLP